MKLRVFEEIQKKTANINQSINDYLEIVKHFACARKESTLFSGAIKEQVAEFGASVPYGARVPPSIFP